MSDRRHGRAALALALALALAWASAHAQAQLAHPPDYLKQLDRDGDGRVSAEEYVAWMRYGFDAMDRNGDGTLQPAEQPGGRGQPLTRAEHRARLLERFHRQDADRDGYLSARELAAPPR